MNKKSFVGNCATKQFCFSNHIFGYIFLFDLTKINFRSKRRPNIILCVHNKNVVAKRVTA